MRLLILEDDPDLLRTLLEGLRISFPTFEIEAVGSAEDAEAVLDRGYEPGLIVCDVRLPGKDGVEFLLDAQSRLPMARFILVSGYEPPESAKRVDPRRMLRFLPKPFELAELAKEVQSAYMKDQFSGRHKRISFLDILQVLNMAGRTSRISLTLEEGGVTGHIYVVNGEVHHATLGKFEGVEAFETLCVYPDAVFTVKAGELPPRRTIHENLGHLLLQSMPDDAD